jgi:hypothetical protein
VDEGINSTGNCSPYVEYGAAPAITEEINGPYAIPPKRVVYEKGAKWELIRPAAEANAARGPQIDGL